MSDKVSVDPERLGMIAVSVARGARRPRVLSFDRGDLGGARADAVYEEFAQYWTPGLDAIADGVEALSGALRSAADACERRDHDDSDRFAGGAYAF